MSKIQGKPLLMISSAFLLLACAAFDIRAQQQPPGERARRLTPTPTPLTTPTPQVTPPKDGRVTGRIRQRAKVQLAAGIYGAIRWKKEYGLPSTDGGQTPNKALNCTAFRVQATAQEGAPGTFGRPQNVGYFGTQNEPTEENGYYGLIRREIPPTVLILAFYSTSS